MTTVLNGLAGGAVAALVDSGTLNGVLRQPGLVDEVSMLVHPAVVGGTSARSFVRGPDPDDGPTELERLVIERPSEDSVWFQYAVVD